MKKFIVCLFVIIPLSLFSQSPVFPVSNAKWGVNQNRFNQGWFQDDRIGPDTVISGIAYQTIIERIDLSGPYNVIGITKTTNDKKVYSRLIFKSCHTGSSDTINYLLYDFNLKENDFFYMHVSGQTDSFRFKVTHIDSVSLNTSKHRRMHLLPWDTIVGKSKCEYWGAKMDTSFYWIEEVGSTFGPLYNSIFSSSNQNDSVVISCFEKDNILEIGDNQCSSLLAVPVLDHKLLKLYPNPVSDYLVVELPGDDTQIQVEIYTIQGRLTYKKTTNLSSLHVGNEYFESGVNVVMLYDAKGGLIRVERIVCIKQ